MKFNSETLQASFDKVKPILEQASIHNGISEDIQELERYLTNLHLSKSFSLNLNFSHTPTHEEELMVWNYQSQGLLYVKNRYSVTCRSNDKGYSQVINYQDKEVLFEIPLKDASPSIKNQIAKTEKLALFISLFAEDLIKNKTNLLSLIQQNKSLVNEYV